MSVGPILLLCNCNDEKENDMDKTHYKVKEIAPSLGLSDYALREWCKTGIIKAVKMRKSWLIPKTEVERLLTEGT